MFETKKGEGLVLKRKRGIHIFGLAGVIFFHERTYLP